MDGFVRLAVDSRADELQLLAHQFEMRRPRGVGVAAHPHRVPDGRALGNEIEFERDGIDEEGGRRIVGAADHGGRSGV